MRYRQLRTAYLLILFYLFGAFASATHIHKDLTEVHTDCKICMLSNSMHGGDVASEPVEIVLLPNYLLPSTYLEQIYINLSMKGYDSQAPPSYFL